MKVISCNVNGLRAALKKGFFDWLKVQDADIVCIQELKAQNDQIEHLKLADYHHYYACAEKKGYSGVGILTKKQPKKVCTTFGDTHIDSEGRYLELIFEAMRVVSLYIPSGSYNQDRQNNKIKLLHHTLYPWLKNNTTTPMIVCGDFNIAHTNNDIKNWKSNQKNSGFLPEEREWMTKILELGYQDTFRTLHAEKTQYTWWSNRSNAWNNNVGWRIDYQISSPSTPFKIKETHVYKDQKFSDHAPLIHTYETL